MLVMFVVGMPVFVLQFLMDVRMFVALGQMQPHAGTRQGRQVGTLQARLGSFPD